MNEFLGILRQLWSLLTTVLMIIGLWFLVTYLPKFRRVHPEPDYIDMRLIPNDETIPVDSTVTIEQFRQGDIVCFRRKGETLFGYVVGRPGEVVTYAYDGQVTVDGRPVRRGKYHEGRPPQGPVMTPAEHLLVLSDSHRHDSLQYGPIPRSVIVGRVKE